MFTGIVTLALVLSHASPGFTLGLTAEMLAPVDAAPVLERVVPVYAPPQARMKAGYYRDKTTGRVSYFDGCNWCSEMGCTLVWCGEPTVIEWKPAR